MGLLFTFCQYVYSIVCLFQSTFILCVDIHTAIVVSAIMLKKWHGVTSNEQKYWWIRSLVASSLLCDSILVEIKCINVHRNTTVFSNCWRKLLHVSALFCVGDHQVETRISETTHILQCGHQDWGNKISFPHSWCPHCSMRVFSDILVSTWWLSTQERAETCSCFLQQFENTVVLQWTFIHLISTSTGELDYTVPHEWTVCAAHTLYCGCEVKNSFLVYHILWGYVGRCL
jgi:hypothetical protein